jgi:hypothetical protein
MNRKRNLIAGLSAGVFATLAIVGLMTITSATAMRAAGLDYSSLALIAVVLVGLITFFFTRGADMFRDAVAFATNPQARVVAKAPARVITLPRR